MKEMVCISAEGLQDALSSGIGPIALRLERQAMKIAARSPQEAESLYRLADALRSAWLRGWSTLA